MRILLLLLASSACMAGPAELVVAPGERAELTGFLAYVGEFQIYQSEDALRRGLYADNPQCVSGVFSRAEQHDLLARRYNGRKVRLVGRYEDWALIFEERVLRDPLSAGFGLQNACGGERVFIADEAFPAE